MSLILGLVLGAAAVIFAIQNITPVSIAFLGWQFEGSVALIIILALIAGLILSILFSIPSFIKNKIHTSKLRSDNAKLQGELEEHKRSLADAHAKLAGSPDPLVIKKTTVVETNS